MNSNAAIPALELQTSNLTIGYKEWKPQELDKGDAEMIAA